MSGLFVVAAALAGFAFLWLCIEAFGRKDSERTQFENAVGSSLAAIAAALLLMSLGLAL